MDRCIYLILKQTKRCQQNTPSRRWYQIITRHTRRRGRGGGGRVNRQQDGKPPTWHTEEGNEEEDIIDFSKPRELGLKSSSFPYMEQTHKQRTTNNTP